LGHEHGEAVALRLLELVAGGLPAEVIARRLQSAGADNSKLLDALDATVSFLRAAERRRDAVRSHSVRYAGIRRTLGALARIDTVDDISRVAFYRRFYARNRPVCIANVTAGGTSFGWTFDRIARDLGSEQVEVMRNRGVGAPDFVDPQAHRAKTSLSAFIKEIHAIDTDDVYLTASNNGMRGPLRRVVADYFALEHLMDWRDADSATLWMGPKGAKSPLHYDKSNVMMVQLLGVKRIRLFAPDEECFLGHDETTLTSSVDPSNHDSIRNHVARYAKEHLVQLEPGKALFIPVGWWHHVESLTPTFSMSLSNFLEPNFFPGVLF
jgi:hypothetical protein